MLILVFLRICFDIPNAPFGSPCQTNQSDGEWSNFSLKEEDGKAKKAKKML